MKQHYNHQGLYVKNSMLQNLLSLLTVYIVMEM